MILIQISKRQEKPFEWQYGVWLLLNKLQKNRGITYLLDQVSFIKLSTGETREVLLHSIITKARSINLEQPRKY